MAELGNWCGSSGFLDSKGACRNPDGCACATIATLRAENEALRAQIASIRDETVVCDVLTMQHSSGFPDYFTRVRKGDRYLTFFMSKIKGQCEYHAAELDWLLNGAERPHIFAFDYTEPEGLSEYLRALQTKEQSND